LSDTEVVWRDLTLGGDGPYVIQSITGWDDLPDITSLDEPRARGHGDHMGSLYSRARIVTVEGKVADLEARDALLRALDASSPVESTPRSLTVDLFGRRLTAGARIVRRTVGVGLNYSVGEVPFAIQWRCPDPLRYGPTRQVTTGLPTGGTGLAYPLAYPLDYGTVGDAGQVTLDNEGTADAPIRFTVSGGLPNGFEISAAGARLTYPYAVPAGQSITVDTADGTVLADGTADRRGNLTWADWLTIPPGRSLTVQFTSLGGEFDPGAQLAAEWAPTYW
jgi:hypothetical protein